MIFVSCENSSSLATRQPQSFSSSSYPFTSTSTPIFFKCEKITTLLFKYHCALREDGTIVSTYGKFSEDLLDIYLVYMHNYTCRKSCIPQIWPEKFSNP